MKYFYKGFFWLFYVMPPTIFFLAIYYGLPERILRYNAIVSFIQFIAVLITVFFCSVATIKSHKLKWGKLLIYFSIILLPLSLVLFLLFDQARSGSWSTFEYFTPLAMLINVCHIFLFSYLLYASALYGSVKYTNFRIFLIKFAKYVGLSLCISFIIFMPSIIVPKLSNALTISFDENPFIPPYLIVAFVSIGLILASAFMFFKRNREQVNKSIFRGTVVYCFALITQIYFERFTRFYYPVNADHVPISIFWYVFAATVDSLFVVAFAFISYAAIKEIEDQHQKPSENHCDKIGIPLP